MRSAACRARRAVFAMAAMLASFAVAVPPALASVAAAPAPAPAAPRPGAEAAAARPAAPAEPEVIHIEGGGGEPESGTAADVPIPAQGVNARQVLSDLWFKYQGLRQRGAGKEADALLTAALGFMQREGLRAAPEIAAAFLAEGRRARRDGDDAGAAEAFRQSLRFDPDRADTRLALAAVLLGGTHELGEGLRELAQGLRALVLDPESIFFIGGAALLILYLGACVGLAAASILVDLRATRAFAHDLQERFLRRSAATAAPVAWAVVALPLVLPIPFTWVLGFWAALVFGYLHGAEKVVVAASLVCLLFAGAFGEAISWFVATATDPAARALLQAGRSGADLRHEDALKEAARAHPDDPIYPFLLGAAYRVGGRFDEAMAMYQHVLEIDPRNARAMVNLGNLHALRQEFAVAQGLYKKAAETDATLVLAHYDSHLAHLETFNMESADEELRRARQVDDATTSRLVAQAEARGAARRAPQDCVVPSRELWVRALRLRRPAAGSSLVLPALLNPTALGAAVGLLAACLVPGLLLAPRSGGAGLCRRCGRGFCRRCQMTTKHPEHCAQCVHLFIVRDGLAPTVRDRKMAEVVGYHRRVYLATRLLTLVLPGSGHVVGGRSLLGALLLVGWGVAWAGLILRSRLLVPPGFRQGTALTIGLVVLLVLAFVTWLAANVTRQQRESA